MAFLEHPRQVLDRDRLLDMVQGREAHLFDRAVDNQISRLRRKVEIDSRNPQLIQTVWGGGYMLAAEVRKRTDRYLIVNPFFHSFGYKAGWVAAFIQGATVYPEQVFDAHAVLTRIAQDRISFLPGPPALFLTMLSHPNLQDFDISSLRVAVTGSTLESSACSAGQPSAAAPPVSTF